MYILRSSRSLNSWPVAVVPLRRAAYLIVALLLTHSAVAAEPGFTRSLFDGETLQGWTVENGCEAIVQDQAILLKAGDGWVRSDQKYGNFVLQIEWKTLKPAEFDAGIYIRTEAEGAPFPKVAHQVNLLQGKEGNIGNITGAVSTGLTRPPGEWNTFVITAIGDTVSVEINGKPAYKVPGLKQSIGYIGLQCEVPKGGQFLFKNIRITELDAQPLFNGQDLAGWEGAGEPAEKCWLVKDGLLQCTGDKGPWLRSKDEYGDFNLRFDYQVSPGGNSGVYVRVPANGNHHRADDAAPPAGFEVQILDDAAAQYKNLKDYQYSGSVYDIAGATRRVCRPAGEWNSLEINCKGQHVTVVHNGVIVVDAAEEAFPLLKLRETKGFLGLQNHSTLVKFRHVRVGAALQFSSPDAASEKKP